MTSIRKAIQILAAVALVGAGFVGSTEASTISVCARHSDHCSWWDGDVDIVLSGLAAGETVGAFSFLLTFNNAIVGRQRSSNDPDDKMGVPLQSD